MPPLKKQRHVQHATATATAGMQPGPSTAPAAAAFPLLSLPHAVLVQHVWPALSPRGRAQLHATCKEVRGLTYELMEPTIQFNITPALEKAVKARAQNKTADVQHAPNHAVASQSGQRQVEEFDGKCALLARRPKVHSLALETSQTMQGKLCHAARRQLRSAAGRRITRLKLLLSHAQAPALRSTLQLIPKLCPELRQLHLDITPRRTSRLTAKDVAALGALPGTLESLSFRWIWGLGEAAGDWAHMARVLGSAAQLTRLRSFKADFACLETEVDVSPLAPIASSLTQLCVAWDAYSPVAGLAELLAACGTSLTSLAMPVYVRAAQDQPRLAQVLVAAPNLQQLEVLVDAVLYESDELNPPPTAEDAEALLAHAKLRHLEVRSEKLCSLLAAAAQQHAPGSLQHLHIDLHHRAEEAPCSHVALHTLLHLGRVSAGCRILCDSHFGAHFLLSRDRTPQDAKVLSALATAWHDAPIDIVIEVTPEDSGQLCEPIARSYLPGTLSVDVSGLLRQPSGRQAVARLLGATPGVFLDHDLLGVLAKEAEAVWSWSSEGLWLLPALAHITTLSWDVCEDDELADDGFALSMATVLRRGHMPKLRCIVFPEAPETAEQLVGVGRVLQARPGLDIKIAQVLSAGDLHELRALLDAVAQPKPRTRKKGTCQFLRQQFREELREVALDDEGRRLLREQLLWKGTIERPC